MSRLQNFIVNTSKTIGTAVGSYIKAKDSVLRRPDFVASLAQESQWQGGQIGQNAEQAQMRAARNSWFYTGVNKKALDLAGSKLDVFNNPSGLEDDGVKAEAHPFYNVLRRPNPYMGKSLLMQYTEWWMDLAGEAFWFINPGNGGVKELWPMPSNKMDMEFTSDGKKLLWYLFKAHQWYRLDPNYVIHFKYPNPWDFFRGLPPLVAFMLTVDADLAMKMWNGAFFGKDNTMPSAVISVGSGDPQTPFEPKDVDALRDQLTNEYSAIKRKTAVVNANTMSVALLGYNAKDMDFLSGMQWNKEEILLGLGIPPGLMDKNATEANAKVGNTVFKDNMWGLKGLIADEITVQCLQTFYNESLEARFEDDRIGDRDLELKEAMLAKDAMTREDWAMKYFGVALTPGSVTMNEAKTQQMLDAKQQQPGFGGKPSDKPTDGKNDKPASDTNPSNNVKPDMAKKANVELIGVPEYKKDHLPTMMLKDLTANKGQRTTEALEGMRKVIESEGITKPIWLRYSDDKLEIIDGKHRVDFANELDIEQVPVIVYNRDGNIVQPEIVYREWLSKGATNHITQAKSVNTLNSDFNALFNKALNFFKQKRIKNLSFTSEVIDESILKSILSDLKEVELQTDIAFIKDHWESVLFDEQASDNHISKKYMDDNLLHELQLAIKTLMTIPIEQEQETVPQSINITLNAQMPEQGQPSVTFSPVIKPSDTNVVVNTPKPVKHVQKVKYNKDGKITGSETGIEYE